MRNLLVNSHIVVVPGLFNISHVRNTGAAWGMMQGFNVGLVVLSVVMLVVLIGFRRHFISDTRLYRVIVGLMIGGILGNLMDRLRLGFVVDFLDFYWQTHHFPSFNVADSAICTGVGLYLLLQFLSSKKERSPVVLNPEASQVRSGDTTS
jgi:signal peptidase II